MYLHTIHHNTDESERLSLPLHTHSSFFVFIYLAFKGIQGTLEASSGQTKPDPPASPFQLQDTEQFNFHRRLPPEENGDPCLTQGLMRIPWENASKTLGTVIKRARGKGANFIICLSSCFDSGERPELPHGQLQNPTRHPRYWAQNWGKLNPAVDSFQSFGADGKEKDQMKTSRIVRQAFQGRLSRSLRLEIFSHWYRAVGGKGLHSLCEFPHDENYRFKKKWIHYENVWKVRGVEQ